MKTDLKGKVLRTVRVKVYSWWRSVRQMKSWHIITSMLFVATLMPNVSIADAPRTESSVANGYAGAVDVGCHTDRSADLGGLIDRKALGEAYRCGRRDFRKISLKNAVLPGIDMSGSDFRGSDLEGVDFSNASLQNTTFVGANLSKARFVGADLSGANLSGANILGTSFDRARIAHASLFGDQVYDKFPKFTGAILDYADLRRVSFYVSRNGDPGADFNSASLIGVDLRDARIRNALNAKDRAGALYALIAASPQAPFNRGRPSSNFSREPRRIGLDPDPSEIQPIGIPASEHSSVALSQAVTMRGAGPFERVELTVPEIEKAPTKSPCEQCTPCPMVRVAIVSPPARIVEYPEELHHRRISAGFPGKSKPVRPHAPPMREAMDAEQI